MMDWQRIPEPHLADQSCEVFDGRLHVTCREGETGINLTRYLLGGEWADQEGRTTVTHSTFLPPTHWLKTPPVPLLRS